jgi:valyl-tRNA synthetase
MDQYGADALRFGLIRIAPVGSDIRFDEAQIEEGRNFANKIYNACRFRQMAGSDQCRVSSDQKELPPYHIDIMAKLDALAANLKGAYAEYRFGEIAQLLYEFLWNEFCDKFLEAVKPDLRESAAPGARAATLATFDAVMARYLQLLSPYMPHIAEELSLRMGYVGDGEFVMRAPLPEAPLISSDASVAQARAAAIYETARRLRNLKTEYNVAARKDVRFVAKGAPAWRASEAGVLAQLCGAAEISADDTYQAPTGTPVSLTPCGEIYLPLEGLIDVAAERQRLGKEIEKTRAEVKKCEAKLANPSFVDRAPPEVVSQEQARLADWRARLGQLDAMLGALG